MTAKLPSAKAPPPESVNAYIAAFAPPVRTVLETLRATVREAAPLAEEIISYRMPAYRQGGILLYFAAFRQHIGVYPPVRGDAELEAALAPYAGEKGNLRIPLDGPMPLDLIARIVRLRLAQEQAKADARRSARRTPPKPVG